MTDSKPTGSWWSALDAPRIGKVYLFALIVNFLLGFTMALVLVVEQFGPGRDAVAPEVFAQLMTMHGVVTVFLCVFPALSGIFGNLLLPRMLGAAELAFPSLNRIGIQLYLLGSLATLLAILGGGLDSGWTLLPPLAAESAVPAGVLAVGLHLVGLSLIVQAFVILASVVKERPTKLAELPVFVWASFAWSVMQILVAPILSSVALMLLGDQMAGAALFDPARGGDPVAYGNFFWFFVHAAMQLTLVLCIGLITEILSAESRKPVHAQAALVVSLLVYALLAPTSWGIHLMAGENSAASAAAFSALSLLAVVPIAVVVYCWLGTLNEGAIRLSVPLLLATAGVVHLGVGVLAGVFLSVLPTNLLLEGTRFSSAQMHYLMLGVWGCALLAGLHQWWTELSGRRYDRRAAMWGAALSVLGFNLAFLPGFVLGARGLLASSYHYPAAMSSLQRVSSVGGGVLCLGLTILAANLLRSWLQEPVVPAEGAREAS